MNQFLLRPIMAPGAVTDEQVDQLRSIPGVSVSRVLTGIVAVSFEGNAIALQALLAGTAWDPHHISESRTYRLQTVKTPPPAHSNAMQIGPRLEDVLMAFAVEQSLPTREHLYYYLAAFPQFRRDLIELAASLVEDHIIDNFRPKPRGTGRAH